jgi:hypothetical protein
VKPSEVLRKAANVIRERGWCQGVYEKEDGRCCALGAVNVIDAQSDDPSPAYIGVEELRLTIGTGAVARWNDEPNRTEAEVITALEATAARLEGEGR